MIDVAIAFLTQIINIVPLFVCVVLVFNLVSDMLFGK